MHLSGEKPSPLATILLPFAANSSQRLQGNKRALAFSLFRVAMIPCLQRPGSPYRSLLTTNAEIHACCSPYRPPLTTRTKIQPPQETQRHADGPTLIKALSGGMVCPEGLPRPEELTCSEKRPVQRNCLLKVQSHLLSIQRKISFCSGFIIFFQTWPKIPKSLHFTKFYSVYIRS